jgi:hypothetical protein
MRLWVMKQADNLRCQHAKGLIDLYMSRRIVRTMKRLGCVARIGEKGVNTEFW